MSSLPRCFDAAKPPPVAPAGARAALGYIGNHRDDRDLRVWTPADWATVADLRQFPVVELAPWLDAVISANACVDEAIALGWSTGRAIVGAMETFEAPAWWEKFEDQVAARGYTPVCYGSIDTVFANRAQRYWVAHYDSRPVLDDPTWWGKQYLSAGSMDWSVLSDVAFVHGGVGPRHDPLAPDTSAVASSVYNIPAGSTATILVPVDPSVAVQP